MRRVQMTIAAGALLLGACGGDPAAETVAGDASTTTTTAASTTTAADTTTTTTTAASATTAADTTTTTTGGLQVAVTDYCVTETSSDDTLNLRAGPGTEFPDIGDLAFDATGIRTTGVGAYDTEGRLWFEIERGDDRVWVASWFLAPDGSNRCGAFGTGEQVAQVIITTGGLEVGGIAFPEWSIQIGGEPGYSDTIAAAVTSELGAPAFDSGWGDPTAEGQSRSIRWGTGFTLFFGNDVGKPDDYPGGLLCSTSDAGDGECFRGLKYFGDPAGVESEIAGLSIGATIEQVIAAIQTHEPLLQLTAPDSSIGASIDDVYRWVQLDTGAPWGLDVGLYAFGGTLCFLTDHTGDEPPALSSEVVMIGTWCSP